MAGLAQAIQIPDTRVWVLDGRLKGGHDLKCILFFGSAAERPVPGWPEAFVFGFRGGGGLRVVLLRFSAAYGLPRAGAQINVDIVEVAHDVLVLAE